MKKYRCVKIVEAEPKKFDEELAERFPKADAKIGDEGYKVRYEEGYESWSPKEVFEKGYVPLETTYKDRLYLEYVELTEKAMKLSDFIESDNIETLSAEKLNLLSLQLQAMDHYRTILLMRMSLEGIEVSEFADSDNKIPRKIFVDEK